MVVNTAPQKQSVAISASMECAREGYYDEDNCVGGLLVEQRVHSCAFKRRGKEAKGV